MINGESTEIIELAEKLRLRSRIFEFRSLDRTLMTDAADRLLDLTEEGNGSLDAEVVLRWLLDHNVKLLKWQRNRLGLED